MLGAYRKAKPESAAGAWKIEMVAGDPGLPPDMVRCHQGNGLGLEVAPAVQRAAVEQHLRESRVVPRGPDHARPAGFPPPRHCRIPDSGDRTDKTIGGNRLRGQGTHGL